MLEYTSNKTRSDECKQDKYNLKQFVIDLQVGLLRLDWYVVSRTRTVTTLNYIRHQI